MPLNVKYDLKQQSGFTLIEVMVALAILAMVAVVTSQASGTYLRSVDNLKTRTLAHFVAQNAAAQLQINPQWLQTPQQSTVTEQGRQWQVTVTPKPNSDVIGKGVASPYTTLQDIVRPVLIQVAPLDSETNKVQHSVTDLTILLSNPEVIGLNETALPKSGLSDDN